METNLSRLLNFHPALVLVGFMIGCGGNTASDNKLPKGDGKKTTKSKPENNSSPGEGNQSVSPKPENNSSLGDGKAATDTANKPKATKFTLEMVKAAMEAAIKRSPKLFPQSERDWALDPKKLSEMTEKLNQAISVGTDYKGMKVNEITVEALTNGILAKETATLKWALLLKSKAFASGLVYALQEYEVAKMKLPAADKWCDALLSVGELPTFYSPQHPDTDKLTGTSSKKPARISHYAFNKAMSRKRTEDPEVVLIFECDLGWHGAGGLEDALKHMEKHKLEKIAVATAGGRARAVTREELKELK